MKIPVVHGYLTSKYGYRVIELPGQSVASRQFHDGLDLGSAVKDDKIVAAFDMEITTVGLSSSFGNRVWGKIISGTYKGLYVVYGHMKELAHDLRVGQQVEEGHELGVIGSTGMSTGVHLHIGLRTKPDVNGTPVYPEELEKIIPLKK